VVIGDWTEDRLLDGRVLLRQPREGLRAGLDAVLLAAAVPAAPAERVLEGGCGSGAAFLCLAARVPGVNLFAVEREPALAELAIANAAANGIAARVTVTTGDVRDLALAESLPPMAHAFANPKVIRAAIDRTHVKPDTAINAASEIAFFPPTSAALCNGMTYGLASND